MAVGRAYPSRSRGALSRGSLDRRVRHRVSRSVSISAGTILYDRLTPARSIAPEGVCASLRASELGLDQIASRGRFSANSQLSGPTLGASEETPLEQFGKRRRAGGSLAVPEPELPQVVGDDQLGLGQLLDIFGAPARCVFQKLESLGSYLK